jgi:hypothetical protein
MTVGPPSGGGVGGPPRDSVDLEANRPEHVDQLVHAFLDTLPPALPRAR